MSRGVGLGWRGTMALGFVVGMGGGRFYVCLSGWLSG